MTPEQRARLPRYAKDAFRDLEIRVRDAEAVAADISAQEAGVWTGRYATHPKPVAQVNEWVRFVVGGHDAYPWIDVKVDAEGALEVMGHGTLLLRPSVTNVVRIEVEPR